MLHLSKNQIRRRQCYMTWQPVIKAVIDGKIIVADNKGISNLHWAEGQKGLKMKDFTIFNAPDRINGGIFSQALPGKVLI